MRMDYLLHSLFYADVHTQACRNPIVDIANLQSQTPFCTDKYTWYPRPPLKNTDMETGIHMITALYGVQSKLIWRLL